MSNTTKRVSKKPRNKKQDAQKRNKTPITFVFEDMGVFTFFSLFFLCLKIWVSSLFLPLFLPKRAKRA